ncbi:MAG: DUF1648 domain-containing protein [Acidobacteria bacterium]|nr:DUF1648 domain-containing protein [Acidobacteriota bacterium]
MTKTTHRATFYSLLGLLWLSLPAIGLLYAQVWSELPLHLATHFDAAGRANGWMTREGSLYFALGFLSFLCLSFSLVLGAIRWKYGESQLSWALLALFHGEVWSIVYLLDSMLGYNLHGTPVSVLPVLVVTPLGVLLVMAVAFGEKRGSAFPPGEVLAEEVHSGRPWSLVFLAPVFGAVAVGLALPKAPLRLALGIFFLVFAGLFAMAWNGFHYFFTRHGVEVRTLGFRLKSIPLGDIQQYAVANWSPLCGYGIRGMGNRKAYVWGNRGVRIKTQDGEFFLGHKEPQRVVQDLDLIKQFAHS